MAYKDFSEMYNDGSYLSKNPTWDASDAPFKGMKILKLLQNHKIPLRSICEVGCGSGEILVYLSGKLLETANFTGFDISRDAINIAKRNESSKIHFEQKDFAKEQGGSHYDLLLVIDVIEHVENYFQFLRDIAPKGRYTIFHIPLDMCIWALFREKMLLESKERVGHIHNFTEDFVKSVLSDCGYKIIDQLYTEPINEPITLKQRFVESCRKILFRLNSRFCSKTMGGVSILVLTENPS